MLAVFFRKMHQKMSWWGPVCITQYKYYGKLQLLEVAIIIEMNNRFFHDSQTIPRCCIAAGCDSISGKGYSFHNFQKMKLCEGSGLMLLNNNEVAGMGRPWILSCAPGISKTTVS